MASNVSPASPINPRDSRGADSDGDPVQNANGGDVLEMKFVINGQGDMVQGLSDIPSHGSGSSVPLGPCA